MISLRFVRSGCAGVLLMALVAVSAASAQTDESWEVTYAVRLRSATGKPVTLRLALPYGDDEQSISEVKVNARGLRSDVVSGDEPEIVLRGAVLGGRRVSVSYRVRLRRVPRTPPRVWDANDPPIEVLSELAPAPLFPSRSILVRDFLETHAAPRIAAPGDMIPAIFAVARKDLARDRGGKSLALDVLRSGTGKRIGIERCFTTFLRCAGYPARFVEGLKLDSSTQRKRVFWTEIWSRGEWWPMSASGGWQSERPAAYLGVVRDGRRIVRLEGEGEVSYAIHAQAVDQAGAVPSKRKR